MQRKKTVSAADELRTLKAGDIAMLANAHRLVASVGSDRFMASGVIVNITTLGGASLVAPFMIADGLSDETIAALRADIKRTHQGRIANSQLSSDDC